MGLSVYLDPCTVNSRKVLAGLDLIDIKYDYNFVNYFTGEHKAEEYVKNVNPHATVPAATDGSLQLTESNSILMYAADLAGNDATYPKDLKARADANRWLLWEASVWFQTNYIYLVEYVVKPLLSAQPDQSVIDKEAPNWHKAAKCLEERLQSTGKWILPGDSPTIVDISVASPVHLHKEQQLPLEKYPGIQAWISRVEALPCWVKTQGAVEKALLPNKATDGSTNGSAKTNGSTNGSAKEVRGSFNYTKDLGDKLTELYFYEDVKANGIHEPGDDRQEVGVINGWDKASSFSVDKEGFAVKSFQSTLPEEKFAEEEIVREKFYPEVVEFLKKELGAKRVLVFDHTIRTRANAAKKLTQESGTSQRAPVALVHCDYTNESAPIRVKQLLPDEADKLLKRRTAFINVWKPLNKVEENPLAMCDVTSSPSSDFFKLYLRYRDRVGENYVMRHSDAHKWYYFPGMTPEQCILLKTYDSDESVARFVGHSAFTDPTSKPDAPFRESCEIRTICFF